jgi:DNA-binding CsgD family transcriptional regulator
MDGWRLHLLLSDHDPAIGALLSNAVSVGLDRDIADGTGNGVAALERLQSDGAVLVTIEPRTNDKESPLNRILTLQERRTVQLSADGCSIAEAAAALYISTTTVKTHLRHAAEKLGVRGRAAAVAEALRRGLIVYRRRARPAPSRCSGRFNPGPADSILRRRSGWLVR